MLARIGVIVKVWFSVFFQTSNHINIIIYSMGTNDDALLTSENPKMHCKGQLCKMGIITQNMPQTLNSLLSSTKPVIGRGNQW